MQIQHKLISNSGGGVGSHSCLTREPLYGKLNQEVEFCSKTLLPMHSDLNDQNLFHSTIDAPSRVAGVSKIANFETTQFMEDPLI